MDPIRQHRPDDYRDLRAPSGEGVGGRPGRESSRTKVRTDRVRDTNRRLVRPATILWFILAICAPLPFGSVHSKAHLLLQGIIFFIAALLALRGSLAPRADEWSGPVRYVGPSLGRILALMVGGVLVATTFHLSVTVPHPIVGTARPYFSSAHTVGALREVITGAVLLYLSVRVLTFDYLTTKYFLGRRLVFLLIAGGVIASLIALMHWFYDNGRLFWSFAPAYEFISLRARWPLVNPNHLGYLLLAPLFLALGRLQIAGGDLVRLLGHLEFRSSGHARALDRWHEHLRTAIVLTFALALIGVIILGTQSRGAFLALGTGLALFLALRLAAAPLFTYANGTDHVVNPFVQRNRPPARLRGLARRFSMQKEPDSDVGTFVRWGMVRISKVGSGFLIVIAIGATALFFQGQGAELLLDRLDYGLASAKDDVRWQLYTDTVKMIGDHPLLGVGLGNWASSYYPYMDKGVAGITPDFLHSDILQSYAEVGIFSLPFMAFALTIFLSSLRLVVRVTRSADARISTLSPHRAQLRLVRVISLTALLATFCGAVVGAGIDFPLRIPAVLYAWILVVALLIYHHDTLRREFEEDRANSRVSSPDPSEA